MNPVKGSFRAVLLLVAALNVGCAPVELRSSENRIDIATGVYLVLPSRDALTESFDATQVITARYDGKERSFQAHLEARPGRIAVVGLNTIGMVIFSISYDGTEMVASGAAEAQVINAEYVLADVLLSHWEPGWLRPRLEGAMLQASAGKRQLLRDGEIIVEIEYESSTAWTGVAQLSHRERGYSLRIENVGFARQ